VRIKIARLRFSLRGLLLMQAILAIAIGSIWWWPKSEPLGLNPSFYVGYYHGLGLINEPGFFGKNWCRISFSTTSLDGTSIVDFRREGYNSFCEYYGDGRLRAEGECMVEIDGPADQPYPDINDVDDATYYRPDGNVGSRVVNGTGTQTYWMSDGRMVWELRLHDHKRTRLRMWNSPTGTWKSRTYDGQGKEIRSL
jgi:hypothetical protein